MNGSESVGRFFQRAAAWTPVEMTVKQLEDALQDTFQRGYRAGQDAMLRKCLAEVAEWKNSRTAQDIYETLELIPIEDTPPSHEGGVKGGEVESVLPLVTQSHSSVTLPDANTP